MTHSLQKSIKTVIETGRIGSPVFLRCMVQAPTEAANVVEGVAALIALANTWMPSSPEQIYAQESADQTQMTATVLYAGGQTAILSVNRLPDGQEASVDVMVIGNRGAIYHQSPDGRHRPMRVPLAFSGGENLILPIRHSIQTGETITLTEE